MRHRLGAMLAFEQEEKSFWNFAKMPASLGSSQSPSLAQNSPTKTVESDISIWAKGDFSYLASTAVVRIMSGYGNWIAPATALSRSSLRMCASLI
jgi:hypothetical protein